ncbi:hypothetical protein NIES4074_13610 [Cylindrospermum sp. NIES-4074]|nr:hypothetical protein NIES4074_13610 [Cylindrospermum sp. NIES-4074]
MTCLRSFNFYLLKLYSVPAQEYDDLLVMQINSVQAASFCT